LLPEEDVRGEGVAWNTPSSAYPRAPLELVRVCHHPNACIDRARAHTLVLFYFFFSFTLDLFLQCEVLMIILWRRLLLVVVGGGHDASKTGNSSWQKQIETKTRREHDIQSSGNLGGLYKQKFNNETKAQEEIGIETIAKANTPQGGAASRGPMPWCGVEPLGSVSNSFSSHDFSYLIKTTKL
jgi:hypothetical protein